METYRIVGLNERVVNSDHLSLAVLDAATALSAFSHHQSLMLWSRWLRAYTDAGDTHQLRKTYELLSARDVRSL
jgi:hypothetical protein